MLKRTALAGTALLILMSPFQPAQGQEVGPAPTTELRLLIQLDLKEDGSVEFVINGIPKEWFNETGEEPRGSSLIRSMLDFVDDPILRKELFVVESQSWESSSENPGMRIQLGVNGNSEPEKGQAVVLSSMNNVNFLVGRVAGFGAVLRVAEWTKSRVEVER